jgi:hypothetical protein
MVWLMMDVPDSLIADTTAQIIKYTTHKFSLVDSAINIHAV